MPSLSSLSDSTYDLAFPTEQDVLIHSRTEHKTSRGLVLKVGSVWQRKISQSCKDATSNKCIATSNKCIASSNKKLVETSASLLVASALPVTRALLVGARSNQQQVHRY